MAGDHRLPSLVRGKGSRRRRKNNLGSLKGQDPWTLREKIIPTDLDANHCKLCFKYREPTVARTKIVFLLPKGNLRNMHLAIRSQNRPSRIDHHRRIIIGFPLPFLKDRTDQGHFFLFSNLPHFRDGGTFQALCQRKMIRFHFLGKPMGGEQFLEADDLSPLLGSDFRKFSRFFDIAFFVFRANDLNPGQFRQEGTSLDGLKNI